MKKYVLILLLALLLSSYTYAVEEYEVEHDFYPSEFVFSYNDHNTTNYEGDTGLIYAFVNNTLDNTSFIVPVERVRSIAYITKGTFKFKEPIIITRSIQRDDGYYILLTMKYKNGTVVPILDIDNDQLTNEQRNYFDNYEQQRSDYLMEQQEYAAEDLYDYYTYSSRQNSKSKYSYYFGTGGSGLIYTPSW